MSGSGCGESCVAANKLINSVGSTVHVTCGPCQSLIQSKEHSYSDMDRDCEQTFIAGASLTVLFLSHCIRIYLYSKCNAGCFSMRFL